MEMEFRAAPEGRQECLPHYYQIRCNDGPGASPRTRCVAYGFRFRLETHDTDPRLRILTFYELRITHHAFIASHPFSA